MDLKGRFPLCISDPQDTLPGSVVIWKPSTPDGHLPISQDAPIWTTHLALGSNDHIPMPLCWYEQCQILRATLVDATNLMGYLDSLFLFGFSPLPSCSKLASFTLLSSALNSAPKFSRTENPCWPDNQSDILPTWSDIPKWVVGHVEFWWNSP